MKSPACHPRSASALVITLLVITVLSIIVVAFMTSMRIERLTARSEMGIQQAALAAEAGLAEAQRKIADATGNDTFAVVMRPKPSGSGTDAMQYYFLINAARVSATTTSYTLEPLFSGTQTWTLTQGHLEVQASGTSGAAVPDRDLFPAAIAISGSKAANRPVKGIDTGWVYRTGPEIEQPFRYCYWVEDLGGKLDLEVVGNRANGTKHARITGTEQGVYDREYPPSEIALFTLFDPTATKDSGTTPAASITGTRGLAVTPETVAALAGSGFVSRVPNIRRAVATGLRYEAEEPETIPAGYGYVDEGRPKHNINVILTSGLTPHEKVEAIGRIVDENLPLFSGTGRRGGLIASKHDYVGTIAAGIVDYADANAASTSGKRSGVAGGYRGLDSFPFVSEIYNQYERLTANGATNKLDVKCVTMVEFWNPTTKPAIGQVRIVNKNRFGVVFNGNKLFGDEGPWEFNLSMEPNEYTCIIAGTAQYSFTSPFPVNSNQFVSPNINSSYEVSWRENSSQPWVLVDMARGGINRKLGVLNFGSREMKTAGSLPGHAYEQAGGGEYFNNLGDPRLAWYAEGSALGQAANDYNSRSSWWGRNDRSFIPTSRVFHATLPSIWPDEGHETQRGGRVEKNSDTPFDVRPELRPATEPAKAPWHISNSGTLARITELGNIWDPAQWAGRWTSVDTSTETARRLINGEDTRMTPDSRAGGGMSLRIGRWELTEMNNPGTRAYQLLDMFTTQKMRSPRGRINLNTADRDALRALGASLFLTRYSALAPQSDIPMPFVTEQADLFADAVIALRSQTPLLSTAPLSNLRVSGSASIGIFGQRAAWKTGAPTAWNDRAAEEFFDRILDHTTVRSRNFRVHVCGQSLMEQPPKSGQYKTVASATRTFQIALIPVRDAGGRITSVRSEVIRISESNE